MAATPVFIGLGSNLCEPKVQITAAVNEIEALAGCRLVARSPLYCSTALGPAGQPDYINAVVEILTELEPSDLLAALQGIENRHGRVRRERWGPRTLDLDILLFGHQVIDSPTLQIPHPEIKNRNFVLYPLADIAPGLALPDGSTPAALLANVPAAGIVRLADGD